MKKLLSSLCLAAATCVILFPSCSPVIYSSTGQNVPLFKEKGEAAASGAYATSGDGKGVSLQGAYAVQDHLAVTGSFYALSGGNHDSESAWKGKGVYGEVAAGRYGSFENSPSLIYEAFAGMGIGSIKNDQMDGSNVDVSYIKPFLQPSIGFKHYIFEIAATPRIGLLHYTSRSANLADPGQENQANAYISNNKTSFVFEPGATLRLGYKNIKLQMQYNFSTYKADVDEDGLSLVNDDSFSIGVHYLFSRLWSK